MVSQAFLVFVKYRIFERMKWGHLTIVFVLFCSCQAYNESLMISLPIDSAQKEAEEILVHSAEARFFLGVLPLDGIDRFDSNVFDELLFEVMARKSDIGAVYKLAGYERYVHRRIGVLTYELRAYYYRDSIVKMPIEPQVSKKESKPQNRVDSVQSYIKKVDPKIPSPDEKLPLGLKTIMLAKKQASATELDFKYVVVVACIRHERFNESIFQKIQKRTESPLGHYSAGDWVRIFVLEEYTEDVRLDASKSFPGAWQCAFGQ